MRLLLWLIDFYLQLVTTRREGKPPVSILKVNISYKRTATWWMWLWITCLNKSSNEDCHTQKLATHLSRIHNINVSQKVIEITLHCTFCIFWNGLLCSQCWTNNWQSSSGWNISAQHPACKHHCFILFLDMCKHHCYGGKNLKASNICMILTITCSLDHLHDVQEPLHHQVHHCHPQLPFDLLFQSCEAILLPFM